MMLIDGHWREDVPANDRGLQYGDGLFETIACRNGRALLWERHLQRLIEGCARLRLPPPEPAQLSRERDLCLARQPDGVLKLIYTRGSGGRGYAPPSPARARRLIALHPLPEYPASHWRGGVRLRLCETRLARQPALAGLKHLNRLEQVLARAEWGGPEIVEGLMRDTDGKVVEGTFTNVFVRFGDTVKTPDLSFCGVRGVMRQRVLEQCAVLGLRTEQAWVTIEDLCGADELWLSNSLIGLWPVRQFQNRAFDASEQLRALQRALAEDCGFIEEMRDGGA
ncbi:aminodeoxychorismate lyase [Alkalilimnicola sp. S0819]|uniref:aminodeoxychorismate lyase n=1 Tax=Alkalilimnicola sp. S0819 TaxID=2613922 RepID=UPI0012624EB0|nr:aminodeoxychorismate lyase [Alkalilimnicola sp. S0819]KAB7627614.1 aminodeoxychorismate lyase [Alkalilimnicola sp. S0819]MPQ15776.1 aminodeoxychorismate lyase [Alkalilimnicola sp. S0819]